ncbi:hypothetical protein CEXT_788131 [Caerostris extrusa]|uniref:Uncharacterized protein n=1 Tax=Caerostris extrusa TaxID=172846 RepID=A0AAV4TCB1_CAEEX|nr:hypothetical protein CEXT_788131 [Caerostris extrusa]
MRECGSRTRDLFFLIQTCPNSRQLEPTKTWRTYLKIARMRKVTHFLSPVKFILLAPEGRATRSPTRDDALQLLVIFQLLIQTKKFSLRDRSVLETLLGDYLSRDIPVEGLHSI